MAYISPNGTIELMKGVNLDNRYMHTLYFADVASQTNFFDALVTTRFTAQSYTRPYRGYVRLRVSADSIMDVTYMRFNNNRTGSRWFYAFVNSVNYVNENTTDVEYEIDVMQTWFFQGGKINPCFVKREHVAVSDDKLKNHLEPEPVATDVYRFDDITPSNAGSFGGYNVVINSSDEITNVDDMMKDGIVCGTKFWSEQTTGHLGDIARHIRESLGSWDKQEQSADITDFYMFPTKYIDSPVETYYVEMKPTGATNTYSPQNMKMYSYPYSFLYATTKGGSNAQYRWEYFDSDMSVGSNRAEFHVDSNSTGGGSVICYPLEYNGIAENVDTKIECDSFPKCSWSYDAYQAFVASGGKTKAEASWKIAKLGIVNNVIETVQGGIGVIHSYKSNLQGAAKAGGSALVGNISGVAKGIRQSQDAQYNMLNGVLDTVQQGIHTYADYKEAKNKVDFTFNDAKYAPDIVIGNQIPNIAVGKGYLGFYFFHCHVDPMEMVRIDNFFTVYGYSVNTVKVPNITGRPYWNFLQTEGAQVTGNMPASSKEAIGHILDGGIFFWNPQHGNANIGNFRQSYNSTSFGEQIKNR